MQNKILISELLMSKICHDLSGSTGAVSNGIELLDEYGEDMKEASLDLIRLGAKESIAKLVCFKMAYGFLRSATLDSSKLKQIADNYLKLKKVSFSWDKLDSDFEDLISEDFALEKIILQSLINLSSLLVTGGIIKLDLEKSSNTVELNFLVTGEKISYENDLLKTINGELQISEDNLHVKNVQIYLLKEIIEKYKFKANLIQDTESCELVLKKTSV